MSWRVMTFLFACATLGVIAYLNMKAGPSYGGGFLPAGAKHEARERDYFFALAFVCWGLWAGAGAVRVFSKFGAGMGIIGITIAVFPAFLNMPVAVRSLSSGISARDSAMRILSPAPSRAVVFAYGDNDTYPVWYMQQVEGTRRDVTTVTIPLLGASWYRAELQRRYGLLDDDYVNHWRGATESMRDICDNATKKKRPIVATPVRDRPPIPEECRSQ